MNKYLPEGVLSSLDENKQHFKSLSTLKDAFTNKVLLEARAIICDNEHNLIVDLGVIKGIIPKNECAIGIDDGTTKDIAIISKVNKPVCFYITGFDEDKNGKTTAILSRKMAQEDCMKDYVKKLKKGDIIDAKVTHLEPFGAFVDIGCGIVSLIPIDHISVSRIFHPKDRFQVGQDIKAICNGEDQNGKLCLTHKELLGTWEENSKNFKAGQTVAGVVRSIESYGIFVELAPNLAGLAELKEGVKVGQHTSCYIKSLIPDKMKIKLIIIDSFDADYENEPIKYYYDEKHISKFKYSPDNCSKENTVYFD